MKKKAKNCRFTFTKSISPIPMTQAEWEASEELLAEFIARAYAAEHPELFGKDKSSDQKEKPGKKRDDSS
jgi:hypothetical protein